MEILVNENEELFLVVARDVTIEATLSLLLSEWIMCLVSQQSKLQDLATCTKNLLTLFAFGLECITPLQGEIAKIKVGSTTETELKDKMSKFTMLSTLAHEH